MRVNMWPPGKPMNQMTQAEKIAEFERRIRDVRPDEAATPRGQAYLAIMRRRLSDVERGVS